MNRDLVWPLGGGLFFGVLASIWAVYQAQAAVEVRPRLNDVDFITALLSGHGHDWMFYFHPVPSAIVWTVFVVIACFIGWRLA